MLEFARSFGAQSVAVVLVAAVALAAAARDARARPGPFGLHLPSAHLATGALLGIALGTLTRRGDAGVPGYLQLVPFRTIRGYLLAGDPSQSATYLVGNVLLFVPLAFFLACALRRVVPAPAFLAAVLACGVSGGVEILQLGIRSRSSDIDDVILNSLGAVAGAAAAAVVGLLPPGWVPRVLAPRAAPARRQAEAPS